MIPNPGGNKLQINSLKVSREKMPFDTHTLGSGTVNSRRAVKHSEEHGRPSCALPAVLRVPKLFCSHVFLPEFMRLLAAAQRALPHASVLCNREGVARIHHRVGGAGSSTQTKQLWFHHSLFLLRLPLRL